MTKSLSKTEIKTKNKIKQIIPRHINKTKPIKETIIEKMKDITPNTMDKTVPINGIT